MAGARAQPGALRALTVLTAINLLNYLDRYIVAGVLPRVEAEFGLEHEEAGLLGTVFVLVYMVAAPLGGYLADRVQRRYVVAGSVALWSLATVMSGAAGSFAALLVARAVIGVGEAGYGSAAPAIISDLYPPERRTRMLAYFYVAIPVGAAAGYALGGFVGEAWSWRAAFFAGGVPGLLLALWMLRSPEPRRGAHDAPQAELKLAFGPSLRRVLGNTTWWFNTAGLTLMTFSIGGLSYWMPAFLELERGMSGAQAGVTFGALTAVAGLLGTVAGGYLGEWADRRTPGGGMWVSGAGLALAAPCMWLAANAAGAGAIFGWLFLAQVLLFLNNGPINAAIVGAVAPSLRAFAMGVNILIIHTLGDAISPPLIGAVGQRSTLEFAIELNALPVLVGGALLAAGALHLRRRRRA